MKKSFLKRFIAGVLAGTMIMTSLSGCGTVNDVADAEVETETDENGDPVGEPRDAADRMAAYENPEEVYDNPLTVEGHDEYTDLSVSVTADESVMNGAESVYIEHVYDSVEAWQEMVNGIEDDAVSREVLGVFDISLLNGDRDRIEPDDSVVVSFSGPMIAEAIKDKRKLELYHLPNKDMDGTASADTDASVVVSEDDDVTEDVETISGNETEDPEADGTDVEQEDSLTAMMSDMEEEGMSMSAFAISEITFSSDDGELISDEESLSDEEGTDTEDEETDADGTDGEEESESGADSVSSNSVEKGIVNEDALQTLSDIPAEEAEDAVERVYPQLADESTIIFDTAGFSEYALVLREDSETQVETQLYGDDEYFEADKYLTMNGHDINGQPSATINIEQAYYTSQKKTLMKAPARHDIVMAIDATGSMGGTVHKTNEFVLYYLYKVMETNQKTLRDAAHGDYEDYLPFEGMADDVGNLLMTFDELKAKTDDDAFNKFKEEHLIYVDGICTFNSKTYTTKENTPLEIITWDDVKQLLDVKCKEGHGCGEEHYTENGDGTVTPNIGAIANPICGVPINGWNDWSAGTHVTGKSMRYDSDGVAGCDYAGSCHVENCWNKVFDPNWKKDNPHVLRAYTRTDLAAKKCKEWMGEIRELHPGNTELSMVLCTDGVPCEPLNGEAVDNGTSNNALQTAKEMKEQYDARIYTAYIPTTNNKKFKVDAYQAIKGMGDSAFKLYAKNPGNGFAFINIQGNPDVDTSDILFMSLFSSDFKHGGVINKKSATINTVNDDIKIKLTNDKEYTPCSCSCPDCIKFRSKRDRCTGTLIKDDERPNDPNAMMCEIHRHEYRFVSGMNPNGEFSDNLAPNGNCQVWMEIDPGTCPTNCPRCVDGLCGGTCTESRQTNNVEFEYPAGGEGYFHELVNGILSKPYTISDAAGNTEDYNIFGNHMYTMDNSPANNITIASEIANRMEQYIFARTNKFDWGYAHNESYIKDVITDPFEITNKNEIKVYAIPRTPKHIDADGIPQHENADGTLVSLDKTKGCNSESELQLLDDADFYWPEQTESGDTDEDGAPVDMWKDVTGSVLIDAAALENNIVIVSGYNYEQYNACSNYDIDFCRSPEMAGDNGLAYRVGDYGYKLLVQIPINSHRSFGGNSIKTNNTDESGFYPSTPGWTEGVDGVRQRPVWTENEEKNPNKNEYVLLYPECKMNLRLNYEIVKDDAVIYAPEMKSVHDLVTDASNNLFAIDPQYAETETELKILKADRETIYAQMAEEGGEAGENYGTYLTDLANKNREIEEKEEFFNLLNSYVPNGSRNMFVDIDYSLISPSGATIATMHIPHGTAYAVDQKTGEPNIDWTITGGKEVTVCADNNKLASGFVYETFRALTETGNYTISCDITPVETVKSPTWHCDDDYPLTAYTPTGSSGIDAEPVNVQGDIGPAKVPLTITENPVVRIFVLEINVNDTKAETETRVDVNDGFKESFAKPIIDFAVIRDTITGDRKVMRDSNTGLYDTSSDPATHITSFRWVCLDGITKSIVDNEPGIIVSETGNVIPPTDPISAGSPKILTIVPDKAFTDGLVEERDGKVFIIAENGKYIPVVTNVDRDYKNVNKGWDGKGIKSVIGAPVTFNGSTYEHNYLNDADNLYTGGSSVSWTHVCAHSDSCNQPDGEVADAVEKYGSDIEYLIHVFENVPPDIHKTTTDGGSIFPTGTFKWTITASNNDTTKNKDKVTSDYSLVDILPHVEDERHTAMWSDGTQLHGTMKYTSIVADFSKAPSAKRMLRESNGKMYYTSDPNVYKYPKSLTANDVLNTIQWKEGEWAFNNDIVTFFGFTSEPVYAFKLDTQLAFGEEITVYIESNTVNPTDKLPGDVAINEAYVWIGDGFIGSEPIPIEVSSLSINGRIWFDEDFDQLSSPNEKGVPNISVGLYKKKNNSAESVQKTLRTHILPDGTTLELVASYNTNNDRVTDTDTDDSGNYSFTDLQPGTYYIVADGLPDGYEIVTKNIAGPRNASTDDSEAEVYYLDNGSNAWRDNSALIKEIVLGATEADIDRNIKGMNIGIQLMNGEITVGKAVKTLKIPNTLPDEDREVYKGAVTFYFHHVETGVDYTKELFLNEQNHMTYHGEPQVWGTVEGLPLGTYIVSETPFKENNDVNVHTEDPNVFLAGSAEGDAQHIGHDQAVVKLTPNDPNAKLWFENELMDHTTGSYNHANMHIPVKLEIQYKGPNPVGDQSMKTYSFKREDFEDMIVTYDDGTQISLKEGTLPFGNVVLTPGSSSNPITRRMNTGPNGKPITVTGYYSERGHIVKDSFKVRVTLKDLNKYTVTFDCNYDSNEGTGFDNGVYAHDVCFIYDEDTQEVEIITGSYKDVKNGKLDAAHNHLPNSNYMLNGTFRQAGWNLEKDGSRKQLSFNGDANNVNHILSAIGKSIHEGSSGNRNTWYANWVGDVTFHANGTYDAYTNHTISNEGYLMNLVDPEGDANKPAIGANIGTTKTVTYNKNAFISVPGDFKGRVSNLNQEAEYDHWSDNKWNEDGSYKDSNILGSKTHTFQGGEQFYAVYYTTEFKYIGRGDAFIAPRDGTYTFKLWGGSGGTTYRAGWDTSGMADQTAGYTEARVRLDKNSRIYVFVGGSGLNLDANGRVIRGQYGGYNGGGKADNHTGGGGGGATHISTNDNPIPADGNGTWDTNGTLAVAGGQGGMGHRMIWGAHHNYWEDAGGYNYVSYGGGASANPVGYGCTKTSQSSSTGIAADNNMQTGYRQGTGQNGTYSGGGGGGWYGGCAITGKKYGVGGGGTGYVSSRCAGGFMVSGNDSRVMDGPYANPVRTFYINTTTRTMYRSDGYCRVSK